MPNKLKTYASLIGISAILTACGASGTAYSSPGEVQNKIKEQFACNTLQSETHDKEDSPAKHDQDVTEPYIWLQCEITDDGAPYAGASLTIRVSESKDASGDKIYKNPTTESDSGAYYVLRGKNWVVLPSSDGDEWKPWIERAQKAAGGEIETYEDFSDK